MAKQRRVNDPDLPLDLQAAIIEADEISEILGELPSDEIKIAIYRMQTGGRPRYVRTYTGPEFSLERLREYHGGGKFQLNIKDGKGSKQVKIIEIEGDPIFDTTNPVIPDGRVSGSRFERKYGVDMSPRSEVENLREEIKELKSIIANGGSNGGQPTMVEMLRLLKELTPNQQTLEDQILAKLSQFKALFGNGGANIETTALFNAMTKGMEIVRNAEGIESASPWMTILERFMPAIQGILTQVMAAKPAGSPYSLPVNQNGVVNMSKQPEPILTGFSALAPKLQPYLPTFINAASNDMDPGIMVDLTASNIATEQYPVVIEWLESSTWFADLSQLSPAIQLQTGWWQEFRKQLLDTLKGSAENHDEG